MTGALPLLIGAGASLATLAGGALVLRGRRRLGLVIGLAAGIVLGVAVLELLPEALRLARAYREPRLAWLPPLGGGLLLYAGLLQATARLRGVARFGSHVAPAALTLHSFIDGCGIGLAFRLGPEAGWGMAAAVLSHDLADGANVAALSFVAHGRQVARRWLVANGAAPLAGVLAGRLVTIPPPLLVALVSALAGGFLLIGAAELLPRSVRLNRPPAAALMALLGFLLVWLGTRFHA